MLVGQEWFRGTVENIMRQDVLDRRKMGYDIEVRLFVQRMEDVECRWRSRREGRKNC